MFSEGNIIGEQCIHSFVTLTFISVVRMMAFNKLGMKQYRKKHTLNVCMYNFVLVISPRAGIYQFTVKITVSSSIGIQEVSYK